MKVSLGNTLCSNLLANKKMTTFNCFKMEMKDCLKFHKSIMTQIEDLTLEKTL